MLNKIIDYLKRKRRSKRFMFGFVLFMLSMITGLSYSVFMISTEKYRVSEMFIANLLYGINITDDDNTIAINGKQVTVGVGTTEIINVTITSLNPVDSNYKLQYKVLSGNGNVFYSYRTNWLPYGSIDKNNEGVYVKKIKVVIENTGTSDLIVDFGASGGYIYNSVGSVALIDGYTAITEEKEAVVAITDGDLITEIVENDTSCDTSTENYCLYGGETKNNYLQYPTNSDKSKNIWRVMGTYNIDGKIVAKMISTTSTTSSYTNAVPNLNNFYNALENTNDYIYVTNKFLCTGSNISCTASSKFSNIGLINIDEYDKIGGLNSYLASSSSYFSMTESNSLVSNITNNGIENVEFSTNSGLRGVVYVQEDVRVTGSGTVDDPFIFVPKGDVNIISWTLDGVNQSGAFPDKSDGYSVSSVTCTNGTTATWNNASWSLEVGNITQVPVDCTVNFETTKYLYAQVLADNPNVSERTDFSTIFTASNNGNTIYKASGQNGINTYYFAGQVTNNYVYFANKYWRIVRINEDNSVRLIYAGTSATDTAAFISTSQKYNTSANNSSHVGYMYTLDEQHGLSANSDIKTVVDNWYINNLNSYSDYISRTAIYCNDRTVASGSTWSATGSSFSYAGYVKLYNTKSPTFDCEVTEDRFTASTSTGNGSLTYPIGLLTMDEAYYAGGYMTNNANYYLTQNASSGVNYWWTMSPFNWYYNAMMVLVGGTSNTGYLSVNSSSGSYGVRPVISLKACVIASGGSGTASDPYTVSLSEGCAGVENDFNSGDVVKISAGTTVPFARVVAPASVVVSKGGSHTFTYEVDEGYEFKNIIGCSGGVGSATYDEENNTFTITNITSNASCGVNFGPVEPDKYTVNVVVNNGTASPTSAEVNAGESVTFTLSPASHEGYYVTSPGVSCTNGQTGTVSSSTGLRVNNVTGDTTCTVSFNYAPIKYTITASVSGGAISGPSSQSVPYGGSVGFTACVPSGYVIDNAYPSCSAGVPNMNFDKGARCLSFGCSNVTGNGSCSANITVKPF